MLDVVVGDQVYSVPSVSELQGLGFRVYVTHKRHMRAAILPTKVTRASILFANLQPVPKPKGGATRVTLLAPDGRWSDGVQKCSRQDAFQPRIGYAFAVNKALAKLGGVPAPAPANIRDDDKVQAKIAECTKICSEFQRVVLSVASVRGQRKFFATLVAETCPDYRGMLFAMYDKRDPLSATLSYLGKVKRATKIVEEAPMESAVI